MYTINAKLSVIRANLDALGLEFEYDANADATRYELPDGAIVFLRGEDDTVVVEPAGYEL